MTLGPGSMRIDDVKPPMLGPDQARVSVSIVGLCGSDYHLFSGKHPYARFPQTQGHEFAGTVRELSANYDGPVKVGDVVAVEPLVPCDVCFACRRGRYNACVDLKVMGAHIPGALADEVVVRTAALYPVGDLDVELAAMVEPVSVGLQAVVRGGVADGSTVVIMGAGPIGLAATLAASARGARVLVADCVPDRLHSALVMGAESIVDTSTADLSEIVREFTDGDGAAVVIDATGVPSLIRNAVDFVAHSGTIVIVGISNAEVSIPVIDFSRKELSILGSRNNTGLFPEAIALVRTHQEQLHTWITQRITLEQVPEMIEFAIGHPESVGKMLVHMKGN